jgi:hypothetical protein
VINKLKGVEECEEETEFSEPEPQEIVELIIKDIENEY